MVIIENSLRSSFSQQEIKCEVDARKCNILMDDSEFRRIQDELRRSRTTTGMAALQFLNQKLTHNIIERRRSSLASVHSQSESLNQKVTRSIIEKRMSQCVVNDENSERQTSSNARVSRVMKRLSFQPIPLEQQRSTSRNARDQQNLSDDDMEEDDDLQILNAARLMGGLAIAEESDQAPPKLKAVAKTVIASRRRRATFHAANAA